MTGGSSLHLLRAEDFTRELGTRRVGRQVIVLEEIDSTNSHALNLAAGADGADGTVVIAEHQSAGRGRLGRRWVSPRGAGLNMTALFVEPRAAFAHGRWMMATAVAALEAIAESTDVEPVIRWPNDLYVRGRKLCGILIETRALGGERLAVAVGIGVNCLQQVGHFPPELRERATSLEIESRQPIERTAVGRQILRGLDEMAGSARAGCDEALAARWREHSGDIGARVTLEEQRAVFTGRILDVHPCEGLLLQLDTGGRRHFDPATTARQ